MTNEAKRADLIARKLEIQAQLGDRTKGNPHDREYAGWRRKAAHALKCIEQELLEINTARREANTKNGWRGGVPAGRPDTSRCEWLIKLVDAKDAELSASGDDELNHEEVIALVDRAVRELLARRILGNDAKDLKVEVQP